MESPSPVSSNASSPSPVSSNASSPSPVSQTPAVPYLSQTPAVPYQSRQMPGLPYLSRMPAVPYQSRTPAVSYQIPDWCGAPWHRYKLEIMQDNKVVGEYNIHGKGTFLFGKLPTCDFQINDDNVSEHHAVLAFKPSGEAFICNLSGNVTVVNQNKVNKHETKELRLGDLIGFGKSKPKRLYAFRHLMSLVETKRIAEKLDVAELKGKRVLVRMDLDVPLNENFQILDDTRLQASVPTIKHLQEKGAKVIICSHLGRPRGVTLKYSLKLLVPRLSELLDVDVKVANESVGDEVKKLVNNLPEGGVLLLENIRLYKEEEQNDPEFAKKLASLADVFVNDSFGTAHLAHASTEGLAKYLKPSVAGFLLCREGHYLVDVLAFPKRPFAAIVGGCNLSSKIGVIEYLLDKVDILLLGGGLIFTFLMAEGYSIGSSLVERDLVDATKKVLKKAKEKQVRMLPTDVVISKIPSADANREVVSVSNISEFSMGMDIGTDSIKRFSDVLGSAKTIIWSGPMGVSELDNFAVGTEAIARKLADLTEKGGVSTIVRGGATVAAVKKLGLQMSHMSAGESDASSLKGKPLPGILALDSVD